MRLMAPLAFLVAFMATPLHADPYDLRGIKLGITMEEFRASPVPRSKQYPEKRVYCTGDDIPRGVMGFVPLELVSGERAKLGVKYCDFAVRYEANDDTFNRVQWSIAGVFVHPILVFIPDPTDNRIYRLAWIEMDFHMDFWDRLWSAYTKKYGKPTKVTESVGQNSFGTKFPKISAVWRNPESSIWLEQRVNTIDRMTIDYLHEDLMKVYDARRKKLRDEEAGKL